MRVGHVAEAGGKCQVLRVIDVLIAKEHHLPRQQGSSDLSDLAVAQRESEIHSLNFCPDVTGLRFNDYGLSRFAIRHCRTPFEVGVYFKRHMVFTQDKSYGRIPGASRPLHVSAKVATGG